MCPGFLADPAQPARASDPGVRWVQCYGHLCPACSFFCECHHVTLANIAGCIWEPPKKFGRQSLCLRGKPRVKWWYRTSVKWGYT